jgi:hypothetical protein
MSKQGHELAWAGFLPKRLKQALPRAPADPMVHRSEGKPQPGRPPGDCGYTLYEMHEASVRRAP